MECPICFCVQLRKIIIPQCSNCHWVCQLCSIALKSCPFCRKVWLPLNSLTFASSGHIFRCCLNALIKKAANDLKICDKIFNFPKISPTIDAIKTIIELNNGTKMNLLQYVIITNNLQNYPNCETCQLVNFSTFFRFHKARKQLESIDVISDLLSVKVPNDFKEQILKLYQPIQDKLRAIQLEEERYSIIRSRINKICLNRKQIDIEELFQCLRSDLRQRLNNVTRKEFDECLNNLYRQQYLKTKNKQVCYIY